MVQSFDFLAFQLRISFQMLSFSKPLLHKINIHPRIGKISQKTWIWDSNYHHQKANFTHLVFKPRPKSPMIPSLSTTKRTVSMYEIVEGQVCLVVLITRSELEVVSDTKDDTNPMKALRPSFWRGSSVLGMYSCKVLKVKNQGKWPTAVADAAARMKNVDRLNLPPIQNWLLKSNLPKLP